MSAVPPDGTVVFGNADLCRLVLQWYMLLALEPAVFFFASVERIAVGIDYEMCLPGSGFFDEVYVPEQSAGVDLFGYANAALMRVEMHSFSRYQFSQLRRAGFTRYAFHCMPRSAVAGFFSLLRISRHVRVAARKALASYGYCTDPRECDPRCYCSNDRDEHVTFMGPAFFDFLPSSMSAAQEKYRMLEALSGDLVTRTGGRGCLLKWLDTMPINWWCIGNKGEEFDAYGYSMCSFAQVFGKQGNETTYALFVEAKNNVLASGLASALSSFR